MAHESAYDHEYEYLYDYDGTGNEHAGGVIQPIGTVATRRITLAVLAYFSHPHI